MIVFQRHFTLSISFDFNDLSKLSCITITISDYLTFYPIIFECKRYLYGFLKLCDCNNKKKRNKQNQKLL